MPKKIATIVEHYGGESYSASEGESGSLIVIRWADFHTMRFTAGHATAAILNGLMEMKTREEVDSFLSQLDGTYEAPDRCLRLPVRHAA